MPWNISDWEPLTTTNGGFPTKGLLVHSQGPLWPMGAHPKTLTIHRQSTREWSRGPRGRRLGCRNTHTRVGAGAMHLEMHREDLTHGLGNPGEKIRVSIEGHTCVLCART